MEVEPRAHRVVQVTAPPPPPQWRVEPVGSLKPMHELREFERYLRLPPELEGSLSISSATSGTPQPSCKCPYLQMASARM